MKRAKKTLIYLLIQSEELFNPPARAPVVGELPYIVGAAARAAVSGSWPMLNADLPVDATYVILSCTQDVLIRFISSDLIAGYLTGAYGVYTTAVQHFFLANTPYRIPVKCSI